MGEVVGMLHQPSPSGFFQPGLQHVPVSLVSLSIMPKPIRKPRWSARGKSRRSVRLVK